MKTTLRIGINGFGRIGRCLTRAILENSDLPIEIALINDLGGLEAMAHLLEFDSIHGKFKADISHTPDGLVIDGTPVPVTRIPDPDSIPWSDHSVDIVIEATGKFKSREAVQGHLKAGASRVIISAVASDSDVKTIVMGANEKLLNAGDTVISNASCTTNCAAPMVEIIDRVCGIESGYITTVHSYTGDQTLHDTAHSDLRRARAAALSIIPTTTGAAKAITRIFPHLNGKLGGAGIRVPVPNGSLTDITFHVTTPLSLDALNEIFKHEASSGHWSNYLEYTEKPIVSMDVIGNRNSCVFDALLTSVIGKTVKVVGWYDNEMGYTHRLIDLMLYWRKL